MYPEIEWDEDGYPTEDSLRKFVNSGIILDAGPEFIRTQLKKCADVNCSSYDEEPAEDNYFNSPIWIIHFSTGGWSGAEELIETMLEKWNIKQFHAEWRRGGHYVFKVPRG